MNYHLSQMPGPANLAALQDNIFLEDPVIVLEHSDSSLLRKVIIWKSWKSQRNINLLMFSDLRDDQPGDQLGEGHQHVDNHGDERERGRVTARWVTRDITMTSLYYVLR